MQPKPCTQAHYIHCQQCSLNEMCLPFSLNEQELDVVDNIVQRKRPCHKGDSLFEEGEPLRALYAIRSGSFKSFTIDPQGNMQITGFYLPGEILGFDAIAIQRHESYAQALETGMICELPYDRLDELSNQLPALKKQLLRLMSKEIQKEQVLFMWLNRKTAAQRLALFLQDLSQRLANRGLSPHAVRLTMTRGDVANHLGLTTETISRLLSRFQKENVITVEGKLITIFELERLNKETGE